MYPKHLFQNYRMQKYSLSDVLQWELRYLKKGEMEPFVSEVEGIAAGKKIALFGSYGWGDGQWMRDWEERMSGCGAAIINGAGLICHETPDDAMISECENLGKQIAAE